MFTQEEFDEWRAEARKQAFIDAERLTRDGFFLPTVMSSRWRGKLRCRFCKATGWGGSVERNPLWWGQHHGPNCKHRS